MHFGPKIQLPESAFFERLSDRVDRRDNFLDEDLEDRVRSSEPAAHVARRSQQVLVFDLEPFEVSLAHCLQPLLRQNVVVVSQNEVDVVLKLGEEALET